MNKKIMFGVLLISVFAITLVSAGLVNYLSNTSEIDMKISSPILIDNMEGDATAFGGETKDVSIELTNLANAQIKGRLEVVISNEDISLDDFETLTAGIVEYVDGTEVFSVSDVDMKTVGGFIESIDDTVTGEITFVTTERTFEILETWDAMISLNFEDNVVGDYNVEVTVIPTA